MTHTAPEPAAVTERLDRLERQNRRLRLALIAIAMGVGAVLLTAAMPSIMQTVTAQNFVLVDAASKTRALLFVDHGGETVFDLMDARGTIRAVLEVDDGGGTGFDLLDASGKVKAHLGAYNDGGTSFTLFDASGYPRLVLASAALTSPPRGGTTVTPVAPITAFDKGNVVGRWPQ